MNIPGWLWSLGVMAVPLPPETPWQLLSPEPLVLPAKAGQVGLEMPAWVLCQTVKTRSIPPYKNHGSPHFAVSPLWAWASPPSPPSAMPSPTPAFGERVKKKVSTISHMCQKVMLQGSWHRPPPAMCTCLSCPFSRCSLAAGRSGRDGKPTARCTSKAGEQSPQLLAQACQPHYPGWAGLGWAGEGEGEREPLGQASYLYVLAMP